MRYISNPPNPYLKHSAEFLGEPPTARLEIFEETAMKKGRRVAVIPAGER